MSIDFNNPGSYSTRLKQLILQVITPIDKSSIGLTNVDNTSDANKPLSTAANTALALKAPLASPPFTGNPTAPTPTSTSNNTTIATTAFVVGLIQQVIDNAPGAVNTLAELAAALNNDPSFASTMTTLINTKLSKTSNLADLTDLVAARNNLQLGDAALFGASAFATSVQGIKADGAIQTIVCNNGSIVIDATDPNNLIISSVGGGGGGNLTGPNSAVSGNFSSYGDTSGHLIVDSGYSNASFALVANGITSGERTKLGNLTLTGAVSLDALKTKSDLLTVTSATNLDTVRTKTGFLTVTAATDLDDIRTKVAGLDQAVILKGTWAANAGTFPGSGAAQAGYVYIVTTAGTVNGVTFDVNDRIIAIVDNASTTTYAANWFKEDYTDQVLSVNGLTGAVTVEGIVHAATLANTFNANDELASLNSTSSYSLTRTKYSDLANYVLGLIGNYIGATSTAKTTPVDADSFGISDSAASNALKRLTFTNFKAFLKTYFDTLYAPLITTINAQTGTTYSFVVADTGITVTFGSASATAVTIPSNTTAAITVNGKIDVGRLGAGIVTITAASGVTLNGTSAGSVVMGDQWTGGTLIKIGTNAWWYTGSLA